MTIQTRLYLPCRCYVVRWSSWGIALYHPRLVSEGTCVLSPALPACHYLRISAGLHPSLMWTSFTLPSPLSSRDTVRGTTTDWRRTGISRSHFLLLSWAAGKLPVGLNEEDKTSQQLPLHIWATTWESPHTCKCTYAHMHIKHTYMHFCTSVCTHTVHSHMCSLYTHEAHRQETCDSWWSCGFYCPLQDTQEINAADHSMAIVS